MSDIQAPPRSRDKIPVLPLHKRIAFASLAAVLQNLVVPTGNLIRDVKAYISPPATAPDEVKTYPVRPRLPVR